MPFRKGAQRLIVPSLQRDCESLRLLTLGHGAPRCTNLHRTNGVVDILFSEILFYLLLKKYSVFSLTLPNHKHVPTVLAQHIDGFFVSFGVALEFRTPIILPRGWNLPAWLAAVAVPEAAMDEYDLPQ